MLGGRGYPIVEFRVLELWLVDRGSEHVIQPWFSLVFKVKLSLFLALGSATVLDIA